MLTLRCNYDIFNKAAVLETAIKEKQWFIIDFDSTFTQVEALDELCAISMDGREEKSRVMAEIKSLTNQAMEGTLSFGEALAKRISLLEAHRNHLSTLIETLRKKVSRSVEENRDFFERFREQILVVSNGFHDFIDPIVTSYGVKRENIYANSFRFDDLGNIIGVDNANPLSQDNGKVKLLKGLKLPGTVFVIGDGITDYEIRASGLANKFYAFTENVARNAVIEKADAVAPTFDDFLFQSNLPMRISYPKNRIKVLLLENIHPGAAKIFQNEGYQVTLLKEALDEEELLKQMNGISILGIRSKTQITERVLEASKKLLAIGAFCIGTNQIDLRAANKAGVAVFNAPFSNTRSVVELALAEIIFLMRDIPRKMIGMKQGTWQKSAKGSHEIRGKKLGIIGYGNIGKQLSVVAEAMGMDVYFYDVEDKLSIGNATKVSNLNDLLAMSDVVTLHIDGRKENIGFFGRDQFNQMKQGSVFLNLARGNLVDVNALKEAVNSGKIKGTGVDVFPKEPKTNEEKFENTLQDLENVILTPHVGGSTEEAQADIGQYVPSKLIDFINTGNTFASVNFPNIQLPVLSNAHRLLHIHLNKSGVLSSINEVFAAYQVNIAGQYLQTNQDIGYVITDVEKEYDQNMIERLKVIPNTIKLRVLY